MKAQQRNNNVSWSNLIIYSKKLFSCVTNLFVLSSINIFTSVFYWLSRKIARSVDFRRRKERVVACDEDRDLLKRVMAIIVVLKLFKEGGSRLDFKGRTTLNLLNVWRLSENLRWTTVEKSGILTSNDVKQHLSTKRAYTKLYSYLFNRCTTCLHKIKT